MKGKPINAPPKVELPAATMEKARLIYLRAKLSLAPRCGGYIRTLWDGHMTGRDADGAPVKPQTVMLGFKAIDLIRAEVERLWPQVRRDGDAKELG